MYSLQTPERITKDRVLYEELSQCLQNNAGFKNRFLSAPKLVFQEMGIKVPDSVAIEVHEDRATLKNFLTLVRSANGDDGTASNPLFKKTIASHLTLYSSADFKLPLFLYS